MRLFSKLQGFLTGDEGPLRPYKGPWKLGVIVSFFDLAPPDDLKISISYDVDVSRLLALLEHEVMQVEVFDAEWMHDLFQLVLGLKF